MKRRSLVLLTVLLIGLALAAWIGGALVLDDLTSPVQGEWNPPLLETLIPTPTVTPGWWQQIASPTPQSTTPIP